MTAVVLRADARRLPLPDSCVDLIVTSPPYFGLRSYTDGGAHYAGQIGSEATPGEWLAALVECTREWVRVLRPEGSLFVNLGDKYSTGNSGQSGMAELGKRWAGGGHADVKAKQPSPAVAGWPPKSLLGLPWRYALACTDQLGLILRRDIIWSKPNGLPESVTDRCRSSHEYVFHLVRQPRYFSAVDEIREDHSGPLGKLPGSVWRIPDDPPWVWNIPSQPLVVPAALGVDHFAAFPMELPRRIILGWSPGGVCTGCGHGRRPVTQTDYTKPIPGNDLNGRRQGVGDATWSFTFRREARVGITGYACGCPRPDAPTRPAVVLDPFSGTGTVPLVAHSLGRIGIGIDLSADYCRLAKWRTTDRGELARALEVPKPPPVSDDQLEMFAL